MDKLLQYLNAASDAEREQIRAQCGTSIGYLRKAISVRHRIGAELCVSIERATDGAVTRRDLRPDDWHLIWPELVTADHPAPVEQAA